MSSSQWPPQGGSGGSGTGNVTGPDPSTLFGIPIFGSTDGTVLLDSVIADVGVFISPGDGVDGVGSGLGISFKGSAGGTALNSSGTSGWKVVPISTTDYLEEFAQGTQISFAKGSGPTPEKVFTVRIRPDSSLYLDLGTNASPWGIAYLDGVIAGGKSRSTREILFATDYSGQTQPGVNPWGIGLNSNTGNEFYLGLSPDAGSHYLDAFNVVSSTLTSTIVSAPDNAVNDSASAISITVKGADKTAGTGNGGDLHLGGGTSAGGTVGGVILDSATKYGNYHVEPLENNAGNSSTAQTINWATASSQLSTLTGNVTYTFSNPQAGGAYVLRINTGAGSFNATWPASVKWSGGSAPTITATASKVDLINFYYDGSTYYGSFTQNY